jgi:hypothetical protein
MSCRLAAQGWRSPAGFRACHSTGEGAVAQLEINLLVEVAYTFASLHFPNGHSN